MGSDAACSANAPTAMAPTATAERAALRQRAGIRRTEQYRIFFRQSLHQLLVKVIGNSIQGYQEALAEGFPGGVDIGAEGAVEIARGAAGFDLGSLIELDLGHLDAGEAEGAGVVEGSRESGGVDGGDVQTILYY